MQLHLVWITGEVVYNKDMDSRLEKASHFLKLMPGGDAARTRRKNLLRILYHERFLTRKGITWRLKGVLGDDCTRWDLSRITFFIDVLFVRRAFSVLGYQLSYRCDGERKGFYLRGEGELSPEIIRAIRGAVNKVDPRQVEITRNLTPAQRVQQGLSLTNLTHNVVRYRNEARTRETNERT
jgi:hypothetical protein